MSLLSIMLFVGCLGEDPISENTDNESSSEISSEATTDDDSSADDNSSSDSQDPSSDTADDSSEAIIISSEETPESSSETEESSESTTTQESSSSQTSDTVSSEEITSDYDTKGSTSPSGKGIFEDWEDGDAQSALAKNVASENNKDTEDAGGYWYAYTDDKGSTLTTITGGDLVSGDAEIIEAITDNALHVIFNSGNSTEKYPVAGLGVNLMYGTTDDDPDAPRPVDLTGLTKVKLRLKGTPSTIVVAFSAMDATDWGAYDYEFAITDEWTEYEITLNDLKGSAGSDLSSHFIDEQLSELLSMSFSISGADKDKEITLSIDHIQFVGIDEATVPYVDLP